MVGSFCWIKRGAGVLALSVGLGCGAPQTATVGSPPKAEVPAKKVADALEGEVVDAAGKPVADALVAVFAHFDLYEAEPLPEARTDKAGHFRFATLPPGKMGVTATSADHVGAYGGEVTVAPGGSAPHVEWRMGDGGETISGTVQDEKGAPLGGARVFAPAVNQNENEVYMTLTDERGRYALRLPANSRYLVVGDAPPRPRLYRNVDRGSLVVDLRLGPAAAPRPSDEVIGGWLRENAKAIGGTTEADEATVKAFGAIVGEAKLVGMGEATHGSAEFTDWRRRVFQALVRDKGFTVFAVETGWANALALNDYVESGKGDPRKAIRGLVTWKDETEETLALVEWMRAYNADKKHKNKVHFVGFDVYTPQAVPLLLDYLRKVDPGMVGEVELVLAPLAGGEADGTYPELPAAEQERTRLGVERLVAQMDAQRAAYVGRSSEEEWTRGRQLARTMQQAEVSYRDYGARDAQMAENIQWLVDHSPPGTKFVLDAHNGHVATEDHYLNYLGRMLREKWGSGYVSVGFAFGQGSLHAMDWRSGRSSKRDNFTLGAAPRGTFDEALGLAGLPSFVVDLRGARGEVGAWLLSPQKMHHVGTGFGGEEEAFQQYKPGRAFDAVIYLDKVSAIHPLKRKEAPGSATGR